MWYCHCVAFLFLSLLGVQISEPWVDRPVGKGWISFLANQRGKEGYLWMETCTKSVTYQQCIVKKGRIWTKLGRRGAHVILTTVGLVIGHDLPK